MKINQTDMLDTKQKVLVLGLFEGDISLKKNTELLHSELENAKKRNLFKDEFGNIYSTSMTNSAYEKILVISLGKKKDFELNHVRRAAGKAVKFVSDNKYKGFTTNIAEEAAGTKLKAEEIGRAFAEGAVLSNYRFDKYMEKKKFEKITEISVYWGDRKSSASLKKGISEGIIIGGATNFSKEMVNDPPNIATTTYMERKAREIAKHPKVSIKVLNKPELQKLGMNAFLSVSKGSIEPPKLIILEYKGGKGSKTALVGKGITFDSGGYNLKPSGHLEDMKIDMGGAAAVLGTMKAISELEVKKNVLCFIPTCENLISDKAYKPGDIIKAYNGKTIEVMNTDAEGRLILADALAYADDKYKPDIIIDAATLTGACMVALSFYASGLMGTDEKLISEIKHAGEESHDRAWPLPFFEEYHEWMKGDVSDLTNVPKNSFGRMGGAITAGAFLSNFVKNAKWAHLDIAGPAYLPEDTDYEQMYASGAGVRILTYYFMKK